MYVYMRHRALAQTAFLNLLALLLTIYSLLSYYFYSLLSYLLTFIYFRDLKPAARRARRRRPPSRAGSWTS